MVDRYMIADHGDTYVNARINDDPDRAVPDERLHQDAGAQLWRRTAAIEHRGIARRGRRAICYGRSGIAVIQRRRMRVQDWTARAPGSSRIEGRSGIGWSTRTAR